MKDRTRNRLRLILSVLATAIALFILFQFVFLARVVQHGIATGYYDLRRYSIAEGIWSRKQKNGDGDYIPESSLGKIYYKRGEHKKALERFGAAVSENDSVSTTLYDFGNALYRSEDLDKALKQYKKAMLLDPKDQAAKSNYELVLKRQGYKPPPPPKKGEEEKEQSPQEQQKDEQKPKPQDPQPQQDDKKEQYRNTLDALDQKEAIDRLSRNKPQKPADGGKWW